MKHSAAAGVVGWPVTLVSDFWYAARSLRRQPIVVVATIATLALGIGANVAVFLVAQAALFKSSGFSKPERIVVLENAEGTYYGSRDSLKAPAIEDWQRQVAVFQEVAVYARGSGNLQTETGAERVSIGLITPRLLSVLGIIPAAGRDFLPDEQISNRSDVAILSDRLWRQDFAASRDIIGKRLELNGHTYTIVGIMPRDFRFPGETDVWIPLMVPFDVNQIQMLRLALIQTVVARLHDGVSLRDAQRTTDMVGQKFVSRGMSNDGSQKVLVTPFLSYLSRGRATGLALLAGMGILLLVIATANVSNLLLTRASSRLHELRLRIAIGGSAGRIAQQVMVEPLLLSLAGGAAGIALAFWCTRAMVAVGVIPEDNFGAILLNARVYLVTVGVSLAAGLFSGMLALATLRKQAQGAPGSSRAGVSRSASTARRALLGIQVALSFVLLVGTGLVLRSLGAMLNQDADLPAGVLTAEIALSPTRYLSQQKQSDFASALLNRLRDIPGVASAGLVSDLPLAGENGIMLEIQVAGSSVISPSENIQAALEGVSPGYFSSMGLAVLRGRDFTESDGLGTQPVAVISANLAQKYWPGSSPIGANLRTPFDTVSRTIIGVVRSIRSYSLAQAPLPQVYYPFSQLPTRYVGLVVSAGNDATKFASEVRKLVRSMDSSIPVFNLRTFGSLRRDSVAPERNRALILAAFGALAIALGIIGVYGAAAYSVEQRTTEIGIRRALGAPDNSVVRRVMVDTLSPVIAGLIAGAIIASAFSRLMSSLLYGVGPQDPMTFSVAGAGLLFVALLATLVPASRATRIDPLEIMRVR